MYYIGLKWRFPWIGLLAVCILIFFSIFFYVERASAAYGYGGGGGGGGWIYFEQVPTTTISTSTGTDQDQEGDYWYRYVVMRSDIARDGVIDIKDFNALMVNWGEGKAGNLADINEDGAVDIYDFNMVMVYWGQTEYS